MSYIIKESDKILAKQQTESEIDGYNKSEINGLLNIQQQKIDNNTNSINNLEHTHNTDKVE